MADQTPRDRLTQLDDRIAKARKAREPAPSRHGKYQATSLAWRMVLELVIGMGLGCLIGYGLDVLFGTLPIFLMIFALLGFAAGVRTMMRSAEEVNRGRGPGRNDPGTSPDETE
ncbi:F0F1 ATP synthase subunit I [Rhodobacteraceae bacterium 2CG4]|uniref:ATP synthase protein I n=1 Tax=Halovulum marinum TaxID=2662447 RepID=A0A6L5Z414_9RHOB|nr:AtpZ/AtpI family protein [Halovulum marinum]MSU91331.1 F0F1 ATP synthase subunit I [Halovulum marinum]